MNQILFFLFKNNFSLNLIVENLFVFDWYTDINFTAESSRRLSGIRNSTAGVSFKGSTFQNLPSFPSTDMGIVR